MKKFLNGAETALLLKHINSNYKAHPELLLFELMLQCALRTDELAKLRLSDLMLDVGLLRIMHASKGSDTATFPITANNLHVKLRDAIKSLLPDATKDTLLIKVFNQGTGCHNSVKWWMRYIWAKTRSQVFMGREEIQRLGIHCLRHTAAMAAKRIHDRDPRRMPLEAIQRLLRHRSIATTMHYLEKLDNTTFLKHVDMTHVSLYEEYKAH